jgi:hypothetical protein
VDVALKVGDATLELVSVILKLIGAAVDSLV